MPHFQLQNGTAQSSQVSMLLQYISVKMLNFFNALRGNALRGASQTKIEHVLSIVSKLPTLKKKNNKQTNEKNK